MDAAQRGSLWKVSFRSMLGKKCSFLYIGDVTLSGEDRPPRHATNHLRPRFHQPQMVDYQVEYDEDEDETYYPDEDEEFDVDEIEDNRLSTSFLFLLAGGVAGAGKPSCPVFLNNCISFASFSDNDGSV